jgi:hypothetical protein
MKKFLLVSLSVVMFLSIFFAGSVSNATADESKVLQFNTMIGVPKPYIGGTNQIRGLSGGGLPWVIEFASGKLSPNGDVNVIVKGLVLDPNDPDVIARGIGGTNPSPSFKVIVSCLSKDASGNPTTVNVSTGLFPADAEGNAHIKDTVSLPQICIAPILFVTNPNSAWFAATGF